MLPRWVSFLFIMLAEHFSARRSAQIQFMKLQIELLRQKLGGNRVILSPEDRRRLLRAGADMDHAVHDVLKIVTVKTYQQWRRDEAAGKNAGKVGRPRLAESVRNLIIKLARENVGWGVRRVLGELRKLALRPSRSSIRRILVNEGVLPDPNRHAPKGVLTPWRTFVAGHVNTMVACDFFCKRIWTPLGIKMAYVLTFIHLGSRKVLVSPSTLHPTADWMQQQARNVGMWAEDQGIDIRFLIHDRDTKFTEAFDTAFDRKDGGVVKTPFLAPIANCYAESWIGSFKRECLNHLFCFSLGHLDHITSTYVAYHNTVRPHQGLGNVPIPKCGKEPTTMENTEPIGKVGCEEWLGGLLKHYYRAAA
jgi:putative transposase